MPTVSSDKMDMQFRVSVAVAHYSCQNTAVAIGHQSKLLNGGQQSNLATASTSFAAVVSCPNKSDVSIKHP